MREDCGGAGNARAESPAWTRVIPPGNRRSARDIRHWGHPLRILAILKMGHGEEAEAIGCPGSERSKWGACGGESSLSRSKTAPGDPEARLV
jgi:hypothetical protein